MIQKDEFIKETAEKVFSELKPEDRQTLVDNPDPFEYHFGLGMYIRNEFIHGKDLGHWAMMPDNLSTEIIEKVIELCQRES